MGQATIPLAGAGAHPNLGLDALEQLWTVLEESSDAHRGLLMADGERPRCLLEALGSPGLCGLVIAFAQAELYRLLLATYRRRDEADGLELSPIAADAFRLDGRTYPSGMPLDE